MAPTAIRLSEARHPGTGLGREIPVGDFLIDDPPERFDWLFEHTLFCAIEPRRRDDYVRAVLKWLKPQGHYLAVNYLIPDQDGPPFGTTRQELWERFSPHFELVERMGAAFLPGIGWAFELMLWWRRKGACRVQLARHTVSSRIPKGFRNKAQGCEERATLGKQIK